MLPRIVIDNIRPRTPSGEYPPKAAVGEQIPISADIFKDGHDHLGARVSWRLEGSVTWKHGVLIESETVPDEWSGTFTAAAAGRYEMQIEAWTNEYSTWGHHVTAKLGANQPIDLELLEGAALMARRSRGADKPARAVLEQASSMLGATSRLPAERIGPALSSSVAALFVDPLPDTDVTTKSFPLVVDRRRALVGAWYEAFPRSEGGFKGLTERLDAIAAMNFDVLYLPPIHPIGRADRKGKNNTLEATAEDVGSPWAIGSEEGGHTAIHPDLGSLEDFSALVERAYRLDIEVALDYALQCSPDHPWVTEHPEWFHRRADGSIAYAENPPKKYQDIYPINFWPAEESDRVALWNECKAILDFWIARNVHIFRVDNPHTKPMAFWSWIIAEVQREHPDVLFLAEAFTRPKVMAKLAEIGFSQSYTYFTWRTTPQDMRTYVEEISQGPTADYMRPSFWPNTPDILSGPLRNGSLPVFKQRLLLAATLTPTYGVYSGYELCENEPASPQNEEYMNSEKYEIKERNWESPASLAPWISKLNGIRKRHPAFSQLRNIRFHWSNNDQLLVYSKHSPDFSDVVLVIVTFDPWNRHEATLGLDLHSLGFDWSTPVTAFDELTEQSFTWHDPAPYVRIDPGVEIAHILHLRRD